MPRKIVTASDREALIRLASSLPTGSEERRAILAGLISPNDYGSSTRKGASATASHIRRASYRTVVGYNSITRKSPDPQVYDTWLLTSRARTGKKALHAATQVLRQFKSQLENMEAGRAVAFVDEKVLQMTGKIPDWHYYIMPD